MEIERLEGDGADWSDVQAMGRKPYGPPQLIQWGTMTDLTRGLANDLQDLPLDGGTSPE